MSSASTSTAHSCEFQSQKQSAYSFLSLTNINMFLLPLI